MAKLLSIVVPTKDRYKYLFHLIELIKSFDSDQIEMVIQDNNYDNSPIQSYFETHKDHDFIKYAHTKEQIPVSLNSDLAIRNSSGEYVCFIGDDDGVTSYVLDCAQWMKDNDIEAVVPDSVSYDWPDFISVGEELKSRLSHKEFTGKALAKEPAEMLRDLMKKGLINRGNLPLVYHGIVKRSVLNKIDEICGSYFPGPSPDIANGVALSLVVKRYVNISLPIVISGGSATHGGGIRKLKNHVADIDSIPFLPADAKKMWEPNIPKVWTGETVWPESAIKAMRKMGRSDLIDQINFDYMYAWFSAYHFRIRSMAFKFCRNKIKVTTLMFYFIVCRYFNFIRRVVWSKLFNKRYGYKTYRGIQNIQEAATILHTESGILLKRFFHENN